MLSYPGALPHFRSFKAVFTSSKVIGVAVAVSASGLDFLKERHSCVVSCLVCLSIGAFPTLMRWLATAFGLTDGLVELDGCWLEPSWRMRFQLFRLECVKFKLLVVCSHLNWRALSSHSMRWSAVSGSPELVNSSRSCWHSESRQEM